MPIENRSLKLKARILVVEDDGTSRNILVRLLAKHGLDAQAASTGRDALEILKGDSEYDIVLSDWSMPSMDGLELLREIRSTESLRSIYFVMITSKDNVEDKIDALNAGADDYLTKPCHHEELLARVRSGLRIRSLQTELLELEKRMAILHVATAAGHEINNPLTGVFGYLDLLRDGIETGSNKEDLLDFLERISIQAERIRNIVSRLMTLKEVHVKPYIGNQRMLDLTLEEGPEVIADSGSLETPRRIGMP